MAESFWQCWQRMEVAAAIRRLGGGEAKFVFGNKQLCAILLIVWTNNFNRGFGIDHTRNLRTRR
jgi:hypothetical protein